MDSTTATTTRRQHFGDVLMGAGGIATAAVAVAPPQVANAAEGGAKVCSIYWCTQLLAYLYHLASKTSTHLKFSIYFISVAYIHPLVLRAMILSLFNVSNID